MTRQEWRCCGAEFVGTFALVFFGCGSIATIGSNGGVAGHLGVNLVFGTIVAAMIYALGHLSCAHFNPVVTIGFAAARRFPPRLILPYIAAQVGGACLACGFLAILLPIGAASAVHYGATISTLPAMQTFGLETVLTFFLMLVIISVATDAKVNPAIAGAAIGITVMLCGIMGGGLSGCSMNPARSLAPALFAGGEALRGLWLYCIAPIIGAVLGALTYENLRAPQTRSQCCPATCCAVESVALPIE